MQDDEKCPNCKWVGDRIAEYCDACEIAVDAMIGLLIEGLYGDDG